MSKDKDRYDLPVLSTRDRDLPIPVRGIEPHHERTQAIAYPAWFNLSSQRHVRDLAIDPINGDLWLATGGGVLCWRSGFASFTRYSSEHGLPGNAIRAIGVDGSGQVWAAHEYCGLSYLDGDIWRLYPVLGERTVSCFSRDKNGSLWIGTINGICAIDRIHGPTFELPPASGIPRMLSVIDQDDIWLCNARGAFHFDGNTWVHHSAQHDILKLACCGGKLWLGTIGGLALVNLATGDVHRADTWPIGEVTALTLTEDGVWAACGSKVGLATETDWMPIGGQLPRTRITGLAQIDKDEIWIATHDGLLRGTLTGIKFHLTETPPDVIGRHSFDPQRPPAAFSNMIQAIALQHLAQGDSLWIATASGLFRLDLFTESWKRYDQRDLRDVRALVANTTREDIWAASWMSSVYSLKQQIVKESLPESSGPILSLAVGPNAELWATGLDKLYRNDGSTWSLAFSSKMLPTGALIRCLAQASSMQVWIGTSRGLCVYSTATTTIKVASGILGTADIRSLLSIQCNQTVTLWVGTSRGLYSGQPDDLQSLESFDGRVITALAWDSNAEVIWVGTDNGLFRLIDASKGWSLAGEFNSRNSGMAADRVTALMVGNTENGESHLWIGTPCGLSCYTY